MEAAQRHPVSITRNGRPSVVMISAESYAGRQRMTREDLRQTMQRAGDLLELVVHEGIRILTPAQCRQRLLQSEA